MLTSARRVLRVLLLAAASALAAIACGTSGSTAPQAIGASTHPTTALEAAAPDVTACAAATDAATQYTEGATLARSGKSTAGDVAAWREKVLGTATASGVDLSAMDPSSPVTLCIYYGDFGPARGPVAGDRQYEAVQFYVIDGKAVLAGMGFRRSPLVDSLPQDG